MALVVAGQRDNALVVLALLSIGAGTADLAATVIPALLALAIRLALTGLADPFVAERAGRTLAAGPAAPIATADLAVTFRQAGFLLAGVAFAVEPGLAFPATTAAAIIATLLAGAIRLTYTHLARALLAKSTFRALAAGPAAAITATYLARTIRRATVGLVAGVTGRASAVLSAIGAVFAGIAPGIAAIPYETAPAAVRLAMSHAQRIPFDLTTKLVHFTDTGLAGTTTTTRRLSRQAPVGLATGTTDASLPPGTVPATPATAVVPADLVLTVGCTTLICITDLPIAAVAIVRARAAVFASFQVAGAITAVGYLAAPSALGFAEADAQVIPRGLAAIGVLLADTGLAWASAATFLVPGQAAILVAGLAAGAAGAGGSVGTGTT